MKRVVLLGGGHAHIHVLRALAAERLPGAEVVMVTPYPELIYSGMVPGLVAGHYLPAACQVPLAPLMHAAQVRWVEAAATGIDTAARRVQLGSGETAEYDVLSVDTGSTMDRSRIPGAREHGLFVRPIEHFARLFDALVALAARRVLDVVVVGAGAGGVELAMALQYRLAGRGDERARVALVTGGPPPLFGYPETVIARARAALARCRVTIIPEPCAAIEAGAVVLGSGARLACDAPVIATGADAPAYLAGSGLQLDEHGFIATLPTLQSVSHPEVLAAGDVAARADAPRPRSGVYAVRSGPPLAINLRRLVAGGELLPYTPQPRSLNLISCGSRRAIAAWGNLSAEGRWVWWWKNHIDRRFVRRFTRDLPVPAATPADGR